MAAVNTLSTADIDRLMHDRSPAAQLDIVQKLTSQYNGNQAEELSESQSVVANDIFQLLLRQAELQVREMLAANLSQSNKLPAAIVRQMANDVASVATPVLEHSPILSDEELTAIIASLQDEGKLEAIARRKNISESVSDALVETRVEKVVSTLVQNETAAIAGATFDKIVERHAGSTIVVESLLTRSSLPVAVVEKVIERVSETMRRDLEQKFGNLNELKDIRKTLEQSLELAELKMLGFKSTNQDLMKVIQHLDMNNKLTPFSALCMGNLPLFETTLSRTLRIPLPSVHTLLQDPAGFKAAYDRAELPESMFAAAMLAIRAIGDIEREEMEKTGLKPIIPPFQLMERMRLIEMEEPEPVEGAEYLYAIMQHCMRANIRHNTGG